MARRSDHSREQIREMALEAAERIVFDQGPEGISARKVASAIGYTVGTLYLVFDNLDDLLMQVNGRTLDRLHDRMVADQAGLVEPRARLLQLGRTYLRFAEEEPHRWALIFTPRSPASPANPDWFARKVARMFELVEQGLQPLAGAHSPQQLRLAARALWSGVHGVCILAVTGRLPMAGVDSVDELAESLMENYLRGFIAR